MTPADKNIPMILLYTSAARIPAATVTKLGEAGIIAVCVRDLNAVKFLAAPSPLPLGPNAMLFAAMKAINSPAGDQTKAAFFTNLFLSLDEVRKSGGAS